MKILAVDDDTVARMAVHGMATSLGHDCLIAEDGQQAWQMLQSETFDVVITDRVMPDMNGLELCQRIRSTPGESAYVYVVLASGLGEDDEARDGMLAGADDYLAKPLRLNQLALKLIAAERVTAVHRRLSQLNEDLRETTIHDARTNKKLNDANQLQADMIAMLSHDARQPLSAVIGFTEATIDAWATTEDHTKRSLITQANGAARRLDQLIEDVLTMANLESGTINCRIVPVAVADVIAEAVTAAAGQTPVQVRADPDVQALVDPWHLRQILSNLVGNATKYGTAPIAVTTQVTPAGVQIRISDSGEGVPPAFVPHLFERFTRAETGVASRKQGTGLGLYIVARLAEANAGNIAYQSQNPTGACFTLTFPEVTPAPTAIRVEAMIAESTAAATARSE